MGVHNWLGLKDLGLRVCTPGLMGLCDWRVLKIGGCWVLGLGFS